MNNTIQLRRSNMACVVAGLALLTPPGAIAMDWDELQPVPDARLALLRGGFVTPFGTFSFGFERVVFINGALVALTRINISDLANLLSNGGVASASVVQSGASSPPPSGSTVPIANGQANLPSGGSTAAAAGHPAAAAPSVSAVPATNVQANSPAGGTASTATVPAASPATPSVGAVPVANTQAAVPSGGTTAATAGPPATVATLPAGSTSLLITNGQVVQLPSNNATMSTVVQNTLNNQLIQVRTTIDATLASVSALRAQLFSDAFRQSLLGGNNR